jgi:hypothetical protein
LFVAFDPILGVSCANKEYLSNMLKWVTRGHCNRAAVSRNRYGVEKTVDTHKILINAIKFCVCLQEKGYKQTKNESNTYTNNNYHIQINKKSVSQYNKCNQVLPVLSSKDRLIKEPKDFTCCEEVGLRILFNVLILDRYRKSSRKAVLNLSLIVQYKKKCASSSTTPHFS